ISYCNACWYRRTFQSPQLSADQRLILHFGAVDYEAKVWVNDHIVARHEGGYTPFDVDITDFLLAGNEQTIVVCALDDPHDLSGNVVDEVSSYTAMRSVDILGDRFLMNGRPLHLQLVLDQGYWQESGLTAPSDDALRRDVELVKELGFNGVRKHQKIEDPRF